MLMIPRRIPWIASGAAALILIALLTHQGMRPKSSEADKTKSAASAKPIHRHQEFAPPQHPFAPRGPRQPDLPPREDSTHTVGSPEEQEWIARRVRELDALSWNDDVESLRKILAELTQPVPEIRAAALKATREFGSPDAIPYLEAAARQTTDALEQKAINETIEHLRIPPLVEHLDAGTE